MGPQADDKHAAVENWHRAVSIPSPSWFACGTDVRCSLSEAIFRDAVFSKLTKLGYECCV